MIGYLASFISGAVIGIIGFSAYAWRRTAGKYDRKAEQSANLIDEDGLESALEGMLGRTLSAEVSDINFGARP